MYFLIPFPKDCLQHLRYLEWELDAEIEAHGLLPGEQGHASWLNTLELLGNNAILDQFTIEMDMAWEAIQPRGSLDIQIKIGKEEVEGIKSSYYKGIVEPMTTLKGLKNLFIHSLVANWI